MESFESQAELVAGSSENSNAAISRTVLPMVAIVGRPNVGKSSLFNRFLKKRVAVVDDEPGVTRDRNYAVCDWNGREFYLIDTGGMVPDSRRGYDAAIMTQAQIAVDEADVILFVVDAQTLPETVDDKIARLLQSTKKPVIVVANKADNPEMELEAQKFQALGLGEVQPTSATGSRNIGDLLDTVVSSLPEQKTVRYDDAAIRIAVIGRPNVGKSSLVNAILGTERNIVSDIAGTTRDSIDSPLTHNGQKYVLIDTAGLRRKHKVTEDLEFYTNLRALKSLETCDVALIVFDVSEGITSQDMRIIEQAASARRGLVLVANKWDLPEKDSKTADKLTVDYREQLGDLNFIPLVFVSAVEGKRALKPLELAAEVYTRACKRYGTPELNEFLEEAIARQHPPSARGKEIKINYLAQPETNPPTFIFFCNRPEDVAMSYIRYLQNRLREEFDLLGVPFRVKFKKK